MKRGLFLLATVTLSSALCAQELLTSEQARQIVQDFNPQLLERASQNPDVSHLMDELISSYLAKQPADTLAGRYELIALVRNFDNSLALYGATHDYEQALQYSQVGGALEAAAYEHAWQQLKGIFPRIWAVSVQTKEQLLAQYKALQEKGNESSILLLEEDLKQLQTRVGEQLVGLIQQTLAQAKARVLAEHTSLGETSNLQIKTKHKKPVAE